MAHHFQNMKRRSFVGHGLTLLGASCCVNEFPGLVHGSPLENQHAAPTVARAGDEPTRKMRVALDQFSDPEPNLLAFIKQCGVDDVIFNTAKIPGQDGWELADIAALKAKVEDAGLRIFALENVPARFYDKIMLGLPGREEQLEHMRQTIRNVGKAGIGVLGYHFMPNGVWRTSTTIPVRGGALATAFDLTQVDSAKLSHGRVYTEDEMWRNYNWYLERILPVCEEAGVRFALHPDDPPIPSLGGIARLFRSFEGFKRAMDTFNSPMHGLDFCVGCWSEMRGGEGVIEAIRHFGPLGKIVYVHFRDVQGTADKFTECWCNEGNLDMFALMRELDKVGFRGAMIPDHVPRVVDDTPWCHRGRAYTVGYMKAMLRALELTNA